MPRVDVRVAGALAGGLAGLAIAIAIAIALPLPARPRPDAAAPLPADPVTVEVREMAFVPGRIEAPAGAFTLRIGNAGSLEHDFSVEALRISPNVRPGETIEVAIEAAPGVYEVYCSLPGHREAGMAATLVVGPVVAAPAEP